MLYLISCWIRRYFPQIVNYARIEVKAEMARKRSMGWKQKQQNPASRVTLAAFDQEGFNGSKAEAAKSCFRRHFSCLWPRGISMGPRQKQQKSSSWVELLPLTWWRVYSASMEWRQKHNKNPAAWPDSCLNYAWATAHLINRKILLNDERPNWRDN